MLLFYANQYVSTERLVGALWPTVPPKSYASNLYTYVSRLRERIGPAHIDHDTGGYRLRVEVDELDLLVFRAETDLGRRAARAGDLAEAATHFRLAVAQWRERPLADLHVPALDPEVARLESDRLAVFGECVDAELAVGRHVELVGELRAAFAEEPLSERLAGQLMVALQRSGRQAEALAVYREARATVVEETGIDPGPELRELHAQVLRGEAVVLGPAQPGWPVCQLPADIADFSGRQESIEDLASVLGSEQLVVLSGEPGVGKSTLAVRVAHRMRAAFPDGQLFAHLSGATNPRDPADVLAEWLTALGVPGQAIPDEPHARAAAFRSRLADRTMLVVLDDAADPAQVRPLLPGTPDCAVIVTSRRRLSGLAGAHRVVVHPFTDAEASQLLVRIAGDRVHTEPADTARIIAACGNLPLALRIAGTRLALLPDLRIGALADRLEDEAHRLDELTVSDLQVRPSLALSYQALSPAARTTLQLIGIVDLPNLSTLAIAVLRDDSALRPRGQEHAGAFDSDRATEELVESSLLEPAGADSSGEPRYQMHDIVRAFARELALAKDGLAERELASSRLVDTAFALCDLAAHRLPRAMPAPGFTEPAPAPGLAANIVSRVLADPDAWFASERPAIVAGLGVLCRVGQYRKAMLVFERFARFLWLHGHYADLQSCAESLAAAASAAGDEHTEACADAVLALLLHVRGHYPRAVALYRTCVDRLDQAGDRSALAWARVNLAACLIALGKPEESLDLLTRVRFDNDEFGMRAAARTRSGALHRLGRSTEAAAIDTEALASARRGGDPVMTALALQSLSWSIVLTGDLDRASALAEEAVSLLRTTTARSALARSLRALGAVHAGLGRRALALAAFGEALDIATEINEQPRVLSCTRALAASWIADGKADAAIAHLVDCLQAYRDMGNSPAATITLGLLATAYQATGDDAAAAAAQAEALRLSDPRDASTRTLLELLLNLTRPG